MKRGCRTLTAAYIGGYRIPRRRLQNKQIVWDKDSPKLPRIVFVFLWSRCLSSIIDHAIHEIRDRECIIPCVIPFIPRGWRQHQGFGCVSTTTEAARCPTKLLLKNVFNCKTFRAGSICETCGVARLVNGQNVWRALVRHQDHWED